MKSASSLSHPIATLVLACALLVPLLPAWAQAAEQAEAPAWTLTDLNGNPVKSDQFKGKVVILDFWATWCPPCRQEIPGFVDLYRQYGDQGLVVVGISLDEKGPSIVRSFVNKFAMTYPVLMGNAGIADVFGGIESIPTTFVIDRAGQIVSTHNGFTDRGTFEKEIKPLL